MKTNINCKFLKIGLLNKALNLTSYTNVSWSEMLLSPLNMVIYRCYHLQYKEVLKSSVLSSSQNLTKKHQNVFNPYFGWAENFSRPVHNDINKFLAHKKILKSKYEGFISQHQLKTPFKWTFILCLFSQMINRCLNLIF